MNYNIDDEKSDVSSFTINKKTLFWIAGWLFCFPIPLTLLIIRDKNISKLVKVVVFVIAWWIYLGYNYLYISSRISDKSIIDKPNKSNNENYIINNENELNNNEVIITNAQVIESEKAVENIVTNHPISDIEVIMKENHPKYYGSVAQSHLIWDDIEDERITFADEFERYKSQIIVMSNNHNKSGIIKDIQIYFRNDILSLEDTLVIAKDYLPIDILEEYYEFYRSFYTVPIEGVEESTNIDYFIVYHLTDEGKQAYYDKKINYTGIMALHLISQDGGKSINYFTIGNATPKWINFLDTNGLQEIEWHYDFLKI